MYMARKSSKKKSEYLIYELLTILSIIGMFIGIGIIYKSHLDDISADSSKLQKANNIAISLEEYFQTNNSYPSCDQMSGSVDSVRDLLIDIDTNSLSANNNEMIILSECSKIDKENNKDKISYIGDKSCLEDTSKPCRNFSLKYYQQSTGKIISISSKAQ